MEHLSDLKKQLCRAAVETAAIFVVLRFNNSAISLLKVIVQIGCHWEVFTEHRPVAKSIVKASTCGETERKTEEENGPGKERERERDCRILKATLMVLANIETGWLLSADVFKGCHFSSCAAQNWLPVFTWELLTHLYLVHFFCHLRHGNPLKHTFS